MTPDIEGIRDALDKLTTELERATAAEAEAVRAVDRFQLRDQTPGSDAEIDRLRKAVGVASAIRSELERTWNDLAQIQSRLTELSEARERLAKVGDTRDAAGLRSAARTTYVDLQVSMELAARTTESARTVEIAHPSNVAAQLRARDASSRAAFAARELRGEYERAVEGLRLLEEVDTIEREAAALLRKADGNRRLAKIVGRGALKSARLIETQSAPPYAGAR